MDGIAQPKPVARGRQRLKVILVSAVAAGLIVSTWVWRNHSNATAVKSKSAEAVPVLSATVKQSDVPVILSASGTVSAQQTVAVRPQLSAVISSVHIKEGQFVKKGERLFTLDARTEDANLRRTEGQLAKAQADLRNAERNLERQRELFRQNFISQAALDLAENQVEAMRGQLAVDQAAVQATRIARGFSEITAPIGGRTGVVSVYQGSLVQPNARWQHPNRYRTWERRVPVAASGMVNYCLQLYLPHPERRQVGIDEQFEYTVAPPVDMGRARHSRSGRVLLLSSPDSGEGPRCDGAARSDPQPGFHQRQD